MNDNDVLALMLPTQLLGLLSRIKEEALPEVQNIIDDIVSDADLDIEPEENFEHLKSSLDELNNMFENDHSAQTLLAAAHQEIKDAIGLVEERRDDKANDNDDWEWDAQAPGKKVETVLDESISNQARSIFSDIDE